MAKPILTLEQLKTILSYDPEDGSFTWLIRQAFAVWPGKKAGSINKRNYVKISIHGRKYFAHKLAWFFMTGAWSKDHIDHNDGDTTNNRFKNLREATGKQNAQNTKPCKNSISGLLGVTKEKHKWLARIMVHGKSKRVGCFYTPEEAHAAYIKAKRELHPFGNL